MILDSNAADLAQRFDTAMNSGDPVVAASMLTEDVDYRDHRPLGWGHLRGRAQVQELFASTVGAAAEMDVVTEILEDRGDRRALRQLARMRAHPEDGGGEGEMLMFMVTEMRGDLVARIDIFETEAEARAALS